MSPGDQPDPPNQDRPRTFQGWQRSACLVLVGLLLLLMVLVVVSAGLGALGVR
ncbi:MAG TPA: hypothetical protein VI138_01925 [Candidatus Dormibacteraeota bacterium]